MSSSISESASAVITSSTTTIVTSPVATATTPTSSNLILSTTPPTTSSRPPPPPIPSTPTSSTISTTSSQPPPPPIPSTPTSSTISTTSSQPPPPPVPSTPTSSTISTTSSQPPPPPVPTTPTSSNVLPTTRSTSSVIPSPTSVPTTSSGSLIPPSSSTPTSSSSPPPTLPSSSLSSSTNLPPLPSNSGSPPGPSSSAGTNPSPTPSSSNTIAPITGNPQLPGEIISPTPNPPNTAVSPTNSPPFVSILINPLPTENPNNPDLIGLISGINLPGRVVRTVDPFPAVPSISPSVSPAFRNPNPLFPNTNDGSMGDPSGNSGINVWVVVAGVLGALAVTGLIMGFVISRRIYGTSASLRGSSASIGRALESGSAGSTGSIDQKAYDSGRPNTSFESQRSRRSPTNQTGRFEVPSLPALQPAASIVLSGAHSDGIGTDYASRIQPKPPLIGMPLIPIEEVDEETLKRRVTLARTPNSSDPSSTLHTGSGSGKQTMDSRLTMVSIDDGGSIRSSALMSEYNGEIGQDPSMSLSNLGAMVGSTPVRDSGASSTGKYSVSYSLSTPDSGPSSGINSMLLGTSVTTSSVTSSIYVLDDNKGRARPHSSSPDKFRLSSISPLQESMQSSSLFEPNNYLLPPQPAAQKRTSSSSAVHNLVLGDMGATSKVYRLSNAFQE